MRAAVLGANDGIVSTASLIVGVAAADSGRSGVLVAGVAGLVAGVVFWWYGSLLTYVLSAVLLLVPIAVGLSLPKPVK